MPAKGIFALGVGHVRRKTIEPGTRADEPAKMIVVQPAELTDKEWIVLTALKREFAPEEIHESPWDARAKEAGVSLEEFCRSRGRPDETQNHWTVLHFSRARQAVGRRRAGDAFQRALPLGGAAGTRNGGGGEVGRHEILTHCYWREAGPEFRNVNIMAVAHGTDKALLLEHKAAIDRHLAACGIPVSYTNVFWGGRSEIKPSEISPQIYRQWLAEMGAEGLNRERRFSGAFAPIRAGARLRKGRKVRSFARAPWRVNPPAPAVRRENLPETD